MWRPNDWDNPYPDNGQVPMITDIPATRTMMHRAYEVGADAMLKAQQIEPAVRLHNKLDLDTYAIKIAELPDGVWRVLLVPEVE